MINKRLKEHFDEVIKYLNDINLVVGVFLVGSQNYHTDLENSDIDSKAIVLPSYKDIVLNHPSTSTTLHLDNGEQINVIDFRDFAKTLKKQNINFLEVLFTEYKYLNPFYENDWNNLIKYREAIAHYDQEKATKTIEGVAHSKDTYILKRKESNSARIDEYGYDIKSLSELLRMRDFIKDYCTGKSFETCLKSESSDELKKIKNGEIIFNTADLMKLREETLNEIAEIRNNTIFHQNFDTVSTTNGILEYTAYHLVNKSMNFTKNKFIVTEPSSSRNLYLVDSSGPQPSTTLIAKDIKRADILHCISNYLKERNITYHYMRMWEEYHENYPCLKIDFGSYVKFFHWTNKGVE